MPFFDRNYKPITAEQAGVTPWGVTDEGAQDETPSFGETLQANFRINNTIASAMSSKRFGTEAAAADFDPDFNPWSAVKGTADEENWPRYAQARNATDLENIRADIVAERQARDVISRSSLGANLLTGGLAGIADPLILAPGSIAVRGPKLGYSMVKTALATGALSMGVTSTQELLLHASQQTRTIDEGLVPVFASGVLGSMIGGVLAKALTRAELNALSRKMIGELAEGPVGDGDIEAVNSAVAAIRLQQAQAVSGGSAATPIPELKDLGVSGSVASAVSRAAPFTPLAKALRWKSAQARSTFFRLAENSVYLTGTEQGKTTGQAVENLISQWDGRLDIARNQHREAYANYRKGGGKESYAEFNERVALAMRRSDRSSIPEVTQASKAWRSQVIEPGTTAAQGAGLYPEDLHVTTAESYFTRVYNKKLLQAEEFETTDGKAGFKPTVKEYFRTVADRKAFDSDGEFESYLDEIADRVFDRITGRGGEFGFDFQKVTVSDRGPLKERTFNVPDPLIERWLDNDVERVMGKFSRMIGADVEIANAFPESIDQGTKRVTLNGPLQKIREDYKKLREEVADDPKALLRLKADEDEAIETIEAMRDLLRGTYNSSLDARFPTFARVARVANTFSYIRSGGGFVMSSLTDAARLMMTAGTMSHFAAGVFRFATSPAFRALARKEAQLAGTVTDTAKYARMASLAEIADPYAKGTPFERFAVNANRMMTRASGIALWNDWMKTTASALTESRLVKNVMKDWERLPERERRYMTYVGIDKDMAERMRFQIEPSTQGGSPRDKTGFWHSGTEQWGDETAKRAFWAAIDKDVRSTIITPGVADLPLFMHSGLGKSLLQYKSFMIASHQKALVRAIQEGANGSQTAVLMATMSAISIGMFITYLKAVEGNRVEQLSDNPGAWLAEGIDRSGMLTILMEGSATLEKMRGPGMDKYPAGVYTGLQALFPDADQSAGPSRYATRGILGQLLGPTAGTIEDAARLWGWASNPDRREASGGKIALSLLPGRTLPYIRPFLEYGVRPQLDEGQQ